MKEVSLIVTHKNELNTTGEGNCPPSGSTVLLSSCRESKASVTARGRFVEIDRETMAPAESSWIMDMEASGGSFGEGDVDRCAASTGWYHPDRTSGLNVDTGPEVALCDARVIGAAPTGVRRDGVFPKYTVPITDDYITGVVISDSPSMAAYVDKPRLSSRPVPILSGTMRLNSSSLVQQLKLLDLFGHRFSVPEGEQREKMWTSLKENLGKTRLFASCRVQRGGSSRSTVRSGDIAPAGMVEGGGVQENTNGYFLDAFVVSRNTLSIAVMREHGRSALLAAAARNQPLWGLAPRQHLDTSIIYRSRLLSCKRASTGEANDRVQNDFWDGL
ncbi:hypothetical protein EV421DRAFT_1740098 [Armillaria borealis]|uniref:Uncharacterized protein n=1 Tax=Armillaria borealis TaxID=47425 RepID=A0AA39J3Z7_9AGAR|nr:hypothetical protein EV421DRAFT_1740098 [Armillaria borealis]